MIAANKAGTIFLNHRKTAIITATAAKLALSDLK